MKIEMKTTSNGTAAIRAEPISIDWDPSLPVFANQDFLKAVGDDYGWLGGTDQAGMRRCLLPYTIVRKAGLQMVRFRVETIPSGPDLSVPEEKSFLNSVVQHFQKTGADVVIPASTNTIFRTYPEGAAAAPYGTYYVRLDRPEAALWGAVSASHRRHIRSAEKSGVSVRIAPEHLVAAHAIIRETFAKSSMPFMSEPSFMRMMEGLGEHGHLLIGECQGQVQCCAVISFSKHSANYMYGGNIPGAIAGSMHLLHWEAIRLYRQMGVRRYDFCGARISPQPGSKAAGLAAFKERFGADLDQGYMWKYSFRPWRAWVYSTAVRLLRGGDIVDQERQKLKGVAAGERELNVTAP